MNNPMNILKTFFKNGGNPEELFMRAMLGNKSNPMINNLISMAKKGNSEGVETFVRNYFKEIGRDFDSEYDEFINNLKS